MGITISSKRYACDMGYGGFARFRNVVAEQVSYNFYNHYILLSDSSVMFLFGKERDTFFKSYDATTVKFIEEYEVTEDVVDFLLQTDSNGKIDRKQAKQIFELIKDCDNDTLFGYVGRTDCAKMEDMKRIFSDKTKVEWL